MYRATAALILVNQRESQQQENHTASVIFCAAAHCLSIQAASTAGFELELDNCAMQPSDFDTLATGNKSANRGIDERECDARHKEHQGSCRLW